MQQTQIIEVLYDTLAGYSEEFMRGEEYEDERNQLDEAWTLVRHELMGRRFRVMAKNKDDEWEEDPCSTKNGFASIHDAQKQIDELLGAYDYLKKDRFKIERIMA